MKNLSDITIEEIEYVLKLINYSSFISYLTSKDSKTGYWKEQKLEVQVLLSSNEYGDKYLRIYSDGRIILHENDGAWHTGSDYGDVPINTLPIIDYLRKQEYEFNYEK